MRDYGKVAPSFWTGDTGRALRGAGRDVQLVSLYLITGPSANMIGLYHLPVPLLCHHTGLSEQGALKALQRACEGGFARWDAHSEMVFVPMMALHQIGEKLETKDNRHKWVMKELELWRKSIFAKDFYAIYGAAYNLPEASPFEAPLKPLRSQELEQEQEQELKQEHLIQPAGGQRFTEPSVEEVRTYCQERGNSIDPEAFVAHYASKGWKVGKSPMKDWKAAVVTWEKNQKEFSHGKQPTPRVGPGQRCRE